MVNTPIEYMKKLNWNIDDLENAIYFLSEWDKRKDEFYNHSILNKNFDKTEREHYRNCINYWKKRLHYEAKSP